MSEKQEYKYMMTCGHMSMNEVCPFECPDSKPLYDPKDPSKVFVNGKGPESNIQKHSEESAT